MDAIPVDDLRSSLNDVKLRFQAANDPDSPHKAWMLHAHHMNGKKPSIDELADGYNSYREKPSPSDLGAIRVAAVGRLVSPFQRRVQLKGYQRLQPICDDAGRLVDGLPIAVQSRLWCGLPDGTQLTGEGLSRWMLAVFELGNANVAWSSLRCRRDYPSSMEQIRKIVTGEIPLPTDAEWFATLPDFAAASVQAIDILQSWLDDVPNANPASPQPATGAAADDNDEQSPAEPEHVFRPDGDGYDITFHDSGHVSAVRCKGLHQIHRLIQTPMVPVLMTELEGASFVDPHSHQDIADQATLKDVAAKLRDAKSELERATASQDRDTIDVEHCRQEVEKWEGELGKLLGLRGQVRDLNNPYDKKRPKIWGTINTAKQRLRDFGHSELADHLDGSIESERAWFVYVPKLNPIPNWKTEKKDASLRP